MAMSTRDAQYHTQDKRETMQTQGFFSDWINAHGPIADVETDNIFEPSPLAGGPTDCNGYFNTGLNFVLHLVAAGLTIAAGVVHVKAGDESVHLTKNMNETDWISVWCWLMIILPIIAVLLWVIWFGCVMRSFQTPYVATIGGWLFLVTFVCTIKLSYFLEISHSLANNGATDHQTGGMNHGDADADGLAFAALIFQCYILVTSIYTPMSGTYYKLLQVNGMAMEKSKMGYGPSVIKQRLNIP